MGREGREESKDAGGGVEKGKGKRTLERGEKCGEGDKK